MVYSKLKRKNTNKDMAIQDEMLKMITKEIDDTISSGNEKVLVNVTKAKEVAKLLTSLSTDKAEATSLVNQYIAQIKLICKS